MRVHLRPQHRTVEIRGPRRVGALLAELGILPGTAMVIRGDLLLTDGDVVEEGAEVQLRAHNTAFCRPCYLFFFRRQVERAIAAQRMLAPGERVLVAVSGGKDSLALWDLLADLG